MLAKYVETHAKHSRTKLDMCKKDFQTKLCIRVLHESMTKAGMHLHTNSVVVGYSMQRQ